MPSSVRRLVRVALATSACALCAVAPASANDAGIPRALRAPSGAPHAPAAPASPNKSAADDIPSRYLNFYKAATHNSGVGWRLVAAVGKNESDHGRSSLPGVHSGLNYANCCGGPMQICLVSSCGNTWGAYAVDGNGNGRVWPYEPADSIWTAVAILRSMKRIVGSDRAMVLAAYNAGPGNVLRYRGVPPFSETQAYVSNALAYMSALGG